MLAAGSVDVEAVTVVLTAYLGADDDRLRKLADLVAEVGIIPGG
jgi:hypothetical protein